MRTASDRSDALRLRVLLACVAAMLCAVACVCVAPWLSACGPSGGYAFAAGEDEQDDKGEAADADTDAGESLAETGESPEGSSLDERLEKERAESAFDEFSAENEYLIASAIDPLYLVDVQDASKDEGVRAQLYEQTADASQRWRFEEQPDGRFAIRNVNSGKVLMEVAGTRSDSKDVVQAEFDGSDAQLWTMEFNDDSTYSFFDAAGQALQVPSTTLANANRIWVKRADSTPRKDFFLKVAPNEEARGHWTYAQIPYDEVTVEQGDPADAGDSIAAACMALAGFASMDSKSPHGSSPYTRPPNEGYGGNWSVYNQVTSVIPVKYHASCDDGVGLAVRFSGVDDSYPKYGPGRLYEYMSRSSKWVRVGGKGLYWHRDTSADGGWGDAGVNLEPGDVLIRKKVESQHDYVWAHCCIYVGPEHANKKYPGSDLTFYEESFEGKRWAYVDRYDKNRNGEYCVFRRNDTSLDIAGSIWAGVCADEKAKYMLRQSSVMSVNREYREIKEDYVYDDYELSAEGLPEGCTYEGPTSFTYDTDTFTLEAPAMSGDYLFEGWFTKPEGGDAVKEIPKGTMEDVKVYAHTRFLPTYTATFTGLPEDVEPIAPIEFKETSENIALPEPAVPEGYAQLFQGWFYAKTGARATEIPQGTTGDISFEAHWEPNFMAFPYVMVPICAGLAAVAGVVLLGLRKRRGKPAATAAYEAREPSSL